jgi:hypothetical protein
MAYKLFLAASFWVGFGGLCMLGMMLGGWVAD